MFHAEKRGKNGSCVTQRWHAYMLAKQKINLDCAYSEFGYFHKYDTVLNMRWDAIMERVWIFQDSEYARFLFIKGLQKDLNMPEYGWTMPEWTALTMSGFWIYSIKVSQSFEYAASSKYARTRNMARLWI